MINPDAWNPYTFTNAKEVVLIVVIMLLLIVAASVFFVPRQYKRYVISWALLSFWIFTIISATIFGREASDGGKLNLNLFWTFQRAWTGHSGLHWYYIIGNILLFVPLGFLLPVVGKKLERWWIVVLIGGGLSLTVELIQYVTGTGLCELDDLMHNTFGSFVGYQVFVVFRQMVGWGVGGAFRHRADGTNGGWICSVCFIMGLIVGGALLMFWNKPDWTGVVYCSSLWYVMCG